RVISYPSISTVRGNAPMVCPGHANMPAGPSPPPRPHSNLCQIDAGEATGGDSLMFGAHPRLDLPHAPYREGTALAGAPAGRAHQRMRHSAIGLMAFSRRIAPLERFCLRPARRVLASLVRADCSIGMARLVV